MSYNNNQKELIERLKDDAQADAYFYEVLESCKKSNKLQAQEQLVIALKNIAQAQGGLVRSLENILPQTGSESLYNILSSVILKFT